VINHRYQIIPLFVLTGFSKIFELLIFHRLECHLVSNNILAYEQYGFCDNISTESASFRLIKTIFSAWNNKEYIMGLFCNITRAFDCLCHVLLILKLEFYGLKGCILNYILFAL